MRSELSKLGYIEAMLWSSSDDNGEPFDVNYDIDDMSPEMAQQIEKDCDKFISVTSELFEGIEHTHDMRWTIEELAGHDFWLTRNHHGAGFWDGDWHHDEIDDIGEKLTDIAQQFGEQYLYVGDDGKLYLG